MKKIINLHHQPQDIGKNSTINKYLGIENIPNKYHVNIN